MQSLIVTGACAHARHLHVTTIFSIKSTTNVVTEQAINQEQQKCDDALTWSACTDNKPGTTNSLKLTKQYVRTLPVVVKSKY